MSVETHEALVALGQGLTPQEELTEKAIQRMDTAISAWEEDVAPNMVVSGGHSFMLDTPPSLPEAAVMRRYALDRGVPERAIHIEDKSLDTIGNALFTKTQVVAPNDWEHLMIVTSRSHLPRTLKIFRHVFGDDFEVNGVPAPEHVTPREIAYELIGATVAREVLRGTKQGDDEAIRERLFGLVPGYANSSKSHLATQSLLGLMGTR